MCRYGVKKRTIHHRCRCTSTQLTRGYFAARSKVVNCRLVAMPIAKRKIAFRSVPCSRLVLQRNGWRAATKTGCTWGLTRLPKGQKEMAITRAACQRPKAGQAAISEKLRAHEAGAFCFPALANSLLHRQSLRVQAKVGGRAVSLAMLRRGRTRQEPRARRTTNSTAFIIYVHRSFCDCGPVHPLRDSNH